MVAASTDRDMRLGHLARLVEKILFTCHGEQQAMTIEAIREMLAAWAAQKVDRRDIEHILELHLQDFPFVVVSTSKGYFRPQTVDEINHYLNSLESRARCIFRRKSTVVRKALAEGFPREGKRFVSRPRQSLMPEVLT